MDARKFSNEATRAELLTAAEAIYFGNNHDYAAVRRHLLQQGLNEPQAQELVSQLQQRVAGMVDNFKGQLDAGVITDIKISPNPEHTKGNVDPGHVQILEHKMNLLFEMMTEANEPEFIRTVRTILQQDPNNPDALVFIIQYELKQGNTDGALSALKTLFTDYYTEQIAIQLVLDIFSRLPREKALAEFARFSAAINEDARYQLDYCKGLYLKGIGAYDEAIALFAGLNGRQEFSWNYYQMAIMKNLRSCRTCSPIPAFSN
jgi:tetratricopeptide (TPR) repeat protein